MYGPLIVTVLAAVGLWQVGSWIVAPLAYLFERFDRSQYPADDGLVWLPHDLNVRLAPDQDGGPRCQDQDWPR
jgi:hypothetical protein